MLRQLSRLTGISLMIIRKINEEQQQEVEEMHKIMETQRIDPCVLIGGVLGMGVGVGDICEKK